MTKKHKILDILEQLNNTESNDGIYYAEYSIDPKELDLRVNIEDCGNILFPISNDMVAKMIAVTKPAQFGLKDKTLYDKTIRDTNEITADKINISYDDTKFALILASIKHTLGLSEFINLKAHLHNILIYSKDQFFAKHQDTEKLDGMVATLVMVLPSPHIGGGLTIEHYGDKVKCRSENINNTDIKLIVFYSDCPHHVEKVIDGYRVVATYNLVSEPFSCSTPENISIIIRHKKPLKESILAAIAEQQYNKYTPISFISYLLNNQYTKHNLSWDLLKGCDRLRVEAIKEVAKEAELDLALALIEMRETWTINEEYYDESTGPEELIDSAIEIIHAIDTKSKIIKCNQLIMEQALYYHLPNNEFKPFETAYEGYMGNYGNTIDYWYHRAAIIIWKRSDSLVFSFLNDANELIKDLIDNISLTTVSKLEDLWPYWLERNIRAVDDRLLLEFAILLNDSNVAEKILQHCSSKTITRNEIGLISRLFSHYGQQWAIM